VPERARLDADCEGLVPDDSDVEEAAVSTEGARVFSDANPLNSGMSFVGDSGAAVSIVSVSNATESVSIALIDGSNVLGGIAVFCGLIERARSTESQCYSHKALQTNALPKLTFSPRSSLPPTLLNLFFQSSIPLSVFPFALLRQFAHTFEKSRGVEIIVCGRFIIGG
jgi:hypothetical protein